MVIASSAVITTEARYAQAAPDFELATARRAAASLSCWPDAKPGGDVSLPAGFGERALLKPLPTERGLPLRWAQRSVPGWGGHPGIQEDVAWRVAPLSTTGRVLCRLRTPRSPAGERGVRRPVADRHELAVRGVDVTEAASCGCGRAVAGGLRACRFDVGLALLGAGGGLVTRS